MKLDIGEENIHLPGLLEKFHRKLSLRLSLEGRRGGVCSRKLSLCIGVIIMIKIFTDKAANIY